MTSIRRLFACSCCSLRFSSPQPFALPPPQETVADSQRTVQSLSAQVSQLLQDRIRSRAAVRDEALEVAWREYPETELLRQVSGVGTLIALTFVLMVEDWERFQKSRDVGCYVGLRPKRSSSGESEPQLRITKEGDLYLRKMLVQGAH